MKGELNEKGIECEMIKRTQSIYTIFKKINRGYKIENQYDLNYLKIPSLNSIIGE